MANFNNKFDSIRQDWDTPQSLFDKLNQEFKFEWDLAASDKNAKCPKFFTQKDDGLKQKWDGICWMNPPFNKDLKKWILKAQLESKKHNSVVCCLVPFRDNTIWFIIGEVNFNDLDRGLWLPM